MKKLTVLLTSLLILALVPEAISCGGGEAPSPTPTSEPSPIPTSTSTPPSSATPGSINWASISAIINQLANDNGVTINQVNQLTDDIVGVAVQGNCTDFAKAIDDEPALLLLGEPQLDPLDPQGICVIWFRVLSP